MEHTSGDGSGITGIEKFGPKSVGLAEATDFQKMTRFDPLPEAREVLHNAREFVPLRDQVMVRRLAEDEMTEFGTLYLPEEGKEKPMVGVVLRVGRGKFDAAGVLQRCEVQPADIVLFGRYSGTEYRVNNQTVLVMNESQIVGILR